MRTLKRILKMTSIIAVILVMLVACSKSSDSHHEFNGDYTGDYLNRIAFPIGGMGAGMFCLEGNGCISHMSVRHKPDVFNEPFMFGAISVKGLENGAKVLEGPVQDWKVFGSPNTGNGGGSSSYGFPRFENVSFEPHFPFASIKLEDDDIPMQVSVKGWSPFIPNDPDNSSLPVGAFEYTFKNTSGKDQEMVFSYNATNFMKVKMASGPNNQGDNIILPLNNGYVLTQMPRISDVESKLYNNAKFYCFSDGAVIPGLMAEYYDNMNFEGSPKVVRLEKKVNKSWFKSDIPGIPSQMMSARWTGKIKVEKAAQYKLAVAGDDGYRLYINDSLIINNWSDHGEQLSVQLYKFDRNKEYKVKLEYYQNQGGASIRFGYKEFIAEREEYYAQGEFAIFTDEPNVVVDPCWFRGGWFDGRTMLWKDIKSCNTPSGEAISGAEGGSLFVPFKLKNGESKTIKLMFAWYVPSSNLRSGFGPNDNKKCCPGGGSDCNADNCSKYFKPWYAKRFESLNDVKKYWQSNYNELKEKTELFSNTFYDTDLPDEVVEAVAANLTILKSPTVLRQYDGRLWAWEGCGDMGGCCAGSCTHVWNYAQAISRVFPSLERSLRETEFNYSQDDNGHQTFRSALPIRPVFHDFYAASDGQLGGIMKVYREWRISGDNDWLKNIYPKVRSSLDYCSRVWDPKGKGVLEEPHHNTYDIEFWGPDGMCTSFYLGAMEAIIEMGNFVNDDVSRYEELLAKGTKYMENELWNGEYFIQKITWEGLEAPNPAKVTKGFMLNYSPEALKILETEGPKYQYGNGCLSDGILGCWMASMSNLDNFIDEDKMRSHLIAVHKYNFKQDLSDHVNPQRPTYAMGKEGGLLLCTWPKGSELTLPFVYSNEVWTGIEYQVAAHLMELGEVEKGLDIVRAVRERYDGRIRNPFNEYECGHWYARAMSSYGMIQGLTGVFYDAVDQTLYIDSQVGNSFKSFLSTNTGWGTVGLKGGKPFIDVKYGVIPVKKYVVAGKEL